MRPHVYLRSYLGEGDGLFASDLACGASRCALLTSRQASVMPPGAEVRHGRPEEAFSRWARVEIVPEAGDSDAVPFAI